MSARFGPLRKRAGALARKLMSNRPATPDGRLSTQINDVVAQLRHAERWLASRIELLIKLIRLARCGSIASASSACF